MVTRTSLSRVFRTASFKLACIYLGLFTASALLLGAVIFWTTRAALNQQLHDRINTESQYLADVDAHGGLTRLLTVVTRRGTDPRALDYLVQDANGKRIAGEIEPVGTRRGWLELHETAASDDDGDGVSTMRGVVVDLPNGMALGVGDDTSHIGDAESAILRAFAWAIGVTALLGTAGGVWLSQAFLRRVDTISRTAEAIIQGDLGRRMPVRGTGDDMDRLCGTLNRMLDRIEDLMENVRQVSNDIAHDLRTPLSRLYQRLDSARTRGLDVSDYRSAIDGAVIEADGLLATFAALLRIAEVEAGAQRAAFERVALSRVVETVAEAFAPVAEDEGRVLVVSATPGLAVHGDRELLTQMLVNLVENALRHSDMPSPIRISLAETGDRLVLSVEDEGPGIPAAERERVLRRFYRREQSRTTSGSGLGLSLVAAVAGLHGARLHLEDALPERSGFRGTGNLGTGNLSTGNLGKGNLGKGLGGPGLRVSIVMQNWTREAVLPPAHDLPAWSADDGVADISHTRDRDPGAVGEAEHGGSAGDRDRRSRTAIVE